MSFFRTVLIPILLFAFAGLAQASPLVLITPDEAQKPPPKGPVPMASRGITRGPKIELASVPATTSPVKLSLKFQSYGGATIDLDSVKVVYLRADDVELTDRVKPFLTLRGIDIPEAQLPPGTHVVRVDLKDSEGRAGTTSFTLKIDP